MKNIDPKNKKFLFISLFPFCVLVTILLLVPALGLLIDSFQNNAGAFSFENYVEIITNKFHLQAVINSLKISFISAFIGIIIALNMVYWLIKLSNREQNHIITLLNMTSNYAGVPLALGYMLLLGSTGFLMLLIDDIGLDIFSDFNLYSSVGVTLVYIYFQIPMAILLMYPAFLGIHKEWKEASRLLGANEWNFWWHIGLPILLPSIVGTFSILFANGMGAYGTAYALVGSGYNLMSVRIASLVSGDTIPRPQLSSALSVVLAITTITIMLLNEKLAKYMKGEKK